MVNSTCLQNQHFLNGEAACFGKDFFKGGL